MDSPPAARFSPWISRAAVAAGWTIVAVILLFNLVRLATPLPLFAADAGSYLIRALYPDQIAARDPVATAVTNGVHLSLIRAAWRVGAVTGLPYMLLDEVLNAAIYLAGLVALWRVSAKSQGKGERAALLMLALGFAYHRFAFSNLAEGPYVGVLALVLLITRAWYWSRPFVWAVTAGAACAALVLTKPHGVAVVGALSAVAVLDAATRREGLRFAARAGVFALVFLATGNAIQIAAQEPVDNPLLFFMSSFYSSALSVGETADAGALGGQAFAIMGFSALLLAGTPIVIGLAELVGRWRGEGGDFRLKRRDLVFLTLVGALGATLVMVSIFEMKVSSTPSETHRLWGRYFEFYAPMLWLAAAPALGRRVTTGLALACGALGLLALAGLLSLLQRGWLLFPWDSAVLTTFFAPDAVYAPLAFGVPFRALAALACLVAAAALALRARPIVVGAALILTLSTLTTWLDQKWLGEMARYRYVLFHELERVAPKIAARPGRVVVLTPDANTAHLAFLQLHARPDVVFAEPTSPPMGALDHATAVLVTGATPPPGAWSQAYRGKLISLWMPAPPQPLPAAP
jgi:hypothetical protein